MLDIRCLPTPVATFISYKLNIQNCSQRTAYEYAVDLKNFFTFYMKNKLSLPEDAEYDYTALSYEDVEAVTSGDIYEYLLYVASDRANRPATRARKLASIRAFYKYITVKAKKLENDPAKDIESPKVKPALPKFLSVDECRELLTAALNANSKSRKRDYAILTLFLNCGMRLSELAGINLNDIADDLSSVRVLGKGAKERTIYLNESCRSALSSYLEERGSLSCSDRNALWVSAQGNRMYHKTVQYTVKKYLKLAGLESKHYSTHKLRHTAATLMYSTGKVDVRVLKDILGHEQLNTTQIYTHVSNSQMQNAMNANPLASLDLKSTKEK